MGQFQMPVLRRECRCLCHATRRPVQMLSCFLQIRDQCRGCGVGRDRISRVRTRAEPKCRHATVAPGSWTVDGVEKLVFWTGNSKSEVSSCGESQEVQ